MADEEEVQDTQEEHKGCGDPPDGGLVGSAQGPTATSGFKTPPSHPQAHHGPSHLVRWHTPLTPAPWELQFCLGGY